MIYIYIYISVKLSNTELGPPFKKSLIDKETIRSKDRKIRSDARTSQLGEPSLRSLCPCVRMLLDLHVFGIHSPQLHSFDLPSCPSPILAHSLSVFRWIFPAALLGTSSTKTTPPVKYLCLATLVLIHSRSSCSLAAPLDLSWT